MMKTKARRFAVKTINITPLQGEEAKGTMESLRRASDEQASSLTQQLERGEQGAAETEAKLRAQLETMTEELGAANSLLIEQKVRMGRRT